MKLKKMLIAVAFALCATQSIASMQDDDLSGFDFNYSVDLNKQVGLLQVFDDGDRTYFQFTQAEKLPDLYTVDKGKLERVAYEVRPPYIIATGLASKYLLTTKGNKTSIYVTYNGRRIEPEINKYISPNSKEITKVDNLKEASPEPQELENDKKAATKLAESQTTTKVAEIDDKSKKKALITGVLLNVPFFENSISISKKVQDDLAKMGLKIASSERVMVRGRPSVDGDDSIANTRALAIKGYLKKIGINEDNIEILKESTVKKGKNAGFYLSEIILFEGEQHIAKHSQTTEKETKPLPKLEIKTGDLISTQLADWAKQYNYTLDWAADEYRATAPLTLNIPFNETLEAVLGALRGNGVLLDVTTYKNNVIRVVETKL